MRKVFTVLLCVLTFVALVSCNNEKDQTSSAVFSIGNNSRLAITEPVSAYTTSDNLTWLYSATAAEGSKFTYGATTCSKITLEDNYSSEEITLSNGKWSFKLWAVNTTTKDETNNTFNKTFTTDKGEEVKGIVVYEGSADDVLVNGFTSIPIDISNIIADSEATIVFNAVYIIPEGTTDKVAPNRVTLNGAEVNIVTDATDQEEGKYLLITDETLSGTLTIPAGKYEIVISYITTYEDGKSAINVSYPITRTIPTLTTLTLADDIAEETGSFKFNGIMTDGSVGNVYDNNTNQYYNLVEDESTGELKWENDNAPSTGTDTSLLLLDCSLSNDIPDSMINDTFETKNFSADFQKSFYNNAYYNKGGYSWTVYHPAECVHTGKDYQTINESISGDKDKGFVGGYGTKLEPYCFNNIEYLQVKYLCRDVYAYYKWTGGNIDFASDFRIANLCGSFDFNGAEFSNRSINIFGNVNTDSSLKPVTIKNLKMVSDYFYCDKACFIVYTLYYNFSSTPLKATFKNIEASGTLIGYQGASTFINYLNSNCVIVNFENCVSTIELASLTTSFVGGFITLSSKNSATVNLIDSSFKGTTYQPTVEGQSTYTYNYAIGNAQSSNVTVTEDPKNANLDNLYTKDSNNFWLLKTGGYNIPVEKITSTNTYYDTSSGTTVAKATGAVTADFYYIILAYVQNSDGNNNEYYENIRDKGEDGKGVKITGDTVTSTKVRDYTVELSGEDEYKATVDTDNAIMKVGGVSLYYSYKNIVVVQRNSQGKIVKISWW